MQSDWARITRERRDAESKCVPRGSSTARYKIMNVEDVNHAETGIWFTSEQAARDFARLQSMCHKDDWDVIGVTPNAHVVATYRDGADLTTTTEENR